MSATRTYLSDREQREPFRLYPVDDRAPLTYLAVKEIRHILADAEPESYSERYATGWCGWDGDGNAALAESLAIFIAEELQ